MSSRTSAIFFGLAVFSLPFCGIGTLALVTGRDWGFGLQPSWVFLGLSFLFQIKPFLANREKDAAAYAEGNAVGKALILLLAGLLVSAAGMWIAHSGEVRSVVLSRYVRQVVQLGIMLGFVIWPALFLRGPKLWRATLTCLAAGAVVQLSYSALQGGAYYLGGSWFSIVDKVFTSNPAILAGSEELYLGNTFRHVPRLRGTMCEPLYLGSYLLMAIPWVGFCWHQRKAAVGIASALFILLVLTWSRGAWLSVMGQMGVAVFLVYWFVIRPNGGWFSGRVGGRKALMVGLGLMVIVGVFLWAPFPAFQFPRDRLAQSFSNQDWSNLTRIYSMQAGWRAFLLSPLVGIGWGQYAFHFPALVDPMGLQSQFTWPVVNNFFLKILCETGALGLSITVFLGVKLGARSWSGLKTVHPQRRRRILVGVVAVVGVWGQMLTFSQYNLPHIWLVVGLLLASVWDEHPPEQHPEKEKR